MRHDPTRSSDPERVRRVNFRIGGLPTLRELRERSVTVRAAIAFGDWPAVDELVERRQDGIA